MLFALVFVTYIVNVLIFYPGYLSLDSNLQLCQVIHRCGLSDWHPISMVLLWRLAMALSWGHVAAMLLLQLFLLWAALFLIAIYIWKRTGSRKLSVLPLMIGIMPNVLNISGVIWKDNQMAFSLLLAVSLVLIARLLVRHAIMRNVLFCTALLLVVYATTVRTNGLAATLPIAYLIFYVSGWTKNFAYTLGAALVIVAFSLGALTAANHVSGAAKGNTPGVMMSTDVTNILHKEEIRKSNVSDRLEDALLDLSDCSRFSGRLDLEYWHCVDAKKRAYFTGESYNELKNLWKKTVTAHPLSYLSYKFESYIQFMFSDDTQYIWQEGIHKEQNILGLKVKSISLGAADETYTVNFGYRYFPFLFKAWFWLLLSLLILVYTKRLKNRAVIMALSLSAILNILSFIPVSNTTDYRYIYWSAIACMIAVILLATEKRINLRPPTVRKRKSPKAHEE